MSDQATVYVVDDVKLQRDSLCAWLAEVGIETVPLASGRDFVFECRNDGPVVAVLDMQMTLSGEDTYSVMKMRGLSWVPTIFISNTNDIDVVARVLQAGATGFMSKKPENKERLQLLVRSAIEQAKVNYLAGKKDLASSPLLRVTPRQIDIWEQYALKGHERDVDIARSLEIDDSTVRTQKKRMFATLGVESWESFFKKYGNINLKKLHEIVTRLA